MEYVADKRVTNNQTLSISSRALPGEAERRRDRRSPRRRPPRLGPSRTSSPSRRRARWAALSVPAVALAVDDRAGSFPVRPTPSVRVRVSLGGASVRKHVVPSVCDTSRDQKDDTRIGRKNTDVLSLPPWPVSALSGGRLGRPRRSRHAHRLHSRATPRSTGSSQEGRQHGPIRRPEFAVLHPRFWGI